MAAKRILIVDDEDLSRETLADFLIDAELDVVTAASGEAALHLQKKHPFDWCIVDIRMPDMGGIETIVALHGISPRSRFIVYTGSLKFEVSDVLREFGLNESSIIRKPVFDMRVFLNLITT